MMSQLESRCGSSTGETLNPQMFSFYVTTIFCVFFDTISILEHLYEKIIKHCIPACRECIELCASFCPMKINQGITQIFAVNKDLPSTLFYCDFTWMPPFSEHTLFRNFQLLLNKPFYTLCWLSRSSRFSFGSFKRSLLWSKWWKSMVTTECNIECNNILFISQSL